MSQLTPSLVAESNAVDPSVSVLKLGPLPIIRYFLDRLRVREIIDAAAPTKADVSNGRCIEAMIMSIFLDQQHALSRVSGVLEGYDIPSLFGSDVTAPKFHDSRLGDALDDLYEKAPTIYGDIVAKAVKTFGIDIRRLNMDATRVLLHGDYECYEDMVEHLDSIKVPERGWNPTGRWDLKQLLFNLITTEDKIPLLYAFGDGAAAETKEYLAMMKRLNTIQADVSRAVLAVDSKGCAAKTLVEAAKQDLRLVTLVPESFHIQRGLIECAAQRDLCLLHTTEDGAQYYGWSVKRPILIDFETKEEVSTDGLWRYVVVYSSAKADQAREIRRHSIVDEYNEITRKIEAFNKKKLFACFDDAKQEGEDFARSLKAKFHRLLCTPQSDVVLAGRGRKPTSGRKASDRVGWGVTFAIEEIPRPTYKFDPDGMFVLLTTEPDKRRLSDEDVLLGYKGRNVVEICFDWLKGDAAIAPVFLKKVSRIITLGFVFVVWMLIYGLIQRELRLALKRMGGKCPHPDKRMVENPTTRGVLSLFNHVCISKREDGPIVVSKIQLWKSELNRVLELLGSSSMYVQYSRGAPI